MTSLVRNFDYDKYLKKKEFFKYTYFKDFLENNIYPRFINIVLDGNDVDANILKNKELERSFGLYEYLDIDKSDSEIPF